VVANPVQAGLVERPEDWPGLIVWGDCIREAFRPDEYFDPRGPGPETVMLRVASPPLSVGSGYSVDEWRRRLSRAITARVAEAYRQVRAAGLEFLGREAVLGQSFVQRAKSYEEKRVLIPRVAASDPVIRRVLLRVHQAFQSAYRAALKLWQEGLRETSFPYGTWWMRVHHRAGMEPQPG
jgi:putative transposase